MGQAKQRGTKEERISSAKIKKLPRKQNGYQILAEMVMDGLESKLRIKK